MYKPGKELLLADAPSWSYIYDNTPLLDDEINSQIIMIIDNMSMTDILYKKF